MNKRVKYTLLLLLIVVLGLVFAVSVHAHPGRTAADGCHYCRTNCDRWGVPWNARHCHNTGSTPAPPPSTFTPSPPPTPASPPIIVPPPVFTESTALFTVTRVVDGDTIEINYDGALKKIRLIGIDTPETVHPTKPVECFGQEAKAKMQALVAGRAVRIEKDSIGDTVDRYGRLLRYVSVDGVSVNAEMIRQGYAYAYLNFPFAKSTDFKRYGQEAREQQRGLWAPGICAVPALDASPQMQPAVFRAQTSLHSTRKSRIKNHN